ncbi:unnamed protein product [Lactuca saligna]|uniref:Uncharacterized protein n=1 Tax=Lactuca saligna TaxID=75948 RepID=A0AA35ZLR7_LACSI|nr:unnamed protein product [Lactuca saligna]
MPNEAPSTSLQDQNPTTCRHTSLSPHLAGDYHCRIYSFFVWQSTSSYQKYVFFFCLSIHFGNSQLISFVIINWYKVIVSLLVHKRSDQGHLKATSMKIVPLLFPGLCAELFDGNNPFDEDVYFSNHSSEHFTQPPPSVASPSADSHYIASPSGNPNKRAKPSTPRPRAPSASPNPPSCASPKDSITADDLALEMQEALPI